MPDEDEAAPAVVNNINPPAESDDKPEPETDAPSQDDEEK